MSILLVLYKHKKTSAIVPVMFEIDNKSLQTHNYLAMTDFIAMSIKCNKFRDSGYCEEYAPKVHFETWGAYSL